jgi:voltage-dependent calcium channel L type alpha-1D
MGIIQPSDGTKKSGGVFLILRTFRVFRIFKLFKIGDMRMLLDSIIYTISTIGPYVVFLFFFMYIFALVGMSFYAGKIKFNDDDEVDLVNGTPPRENFDTLGDSF